jgi:hypothetical protein
MPSVCRPSAHSPPCVPFRPVLRPTDTCAHMLTPQCRVTHETFKSTDTPGSPRLVLINATVVTMSAIAVLRACASCRPSPTRRKPAVQCAEWICNFRHDCQFDFTPARFGCDHIRLRKQNLSMHQKSENVLKKV